MKSNPQAYGLRLDWTGGNRFIIAGDRWWEGTSALSAGGSGIATIYPEFNLLFLVNLDDDKYSGDFEKTFATSPRWTKTRYAVTYVVNNVDENDRIQSYAAWIFDCETGERLIDVMTIEPVAGREHEVAQLKRGIELLTRGEFFSLY